MQIDKPEQLLGFQLLSSFMQKSSSSKNPAFGIALEAIMKSLMDSEMEKSKLEDKKICSNCSKKNNTNNIEKKFRPSNIKLDTYSHKAKIESEINKASQKFGVNSDLIRAIIKQESDFNPKCVSSAGAMGLMQLMPENCGEDNVNDPFDIEDNIQGGTKQLKRYLNQYGNDLALSLMAYNAGPGTVSRRGVNSINDLYKMPKETQHYVKKIMNSLGMI